MQAVILAGGKGTRLRPYTAVLPKPLVPIGDYPIMEIVVRQLKKHGVREIVVSTGHLAELIESYFGNGKKYGVCISYVRERKPLNTAGALGIISMLKGDFLVMNGDVLTTLDYRDLFSFHKKRKGIATIAVTKRFVRDNYGVVEMNDDFALADYHEKPTRSYYISMGINILNVRCKKFIGKNESISMPDLLLRLKRNGEKIMCFRSEDRWLDIGRIEDFTVAQYEFKKNQEKYI